MAKSSYVLRALKILGLEEVLKLSEVLNVRQVSLKKAAGDDFIVWDSTSVEKVEVEKTEPLGKVLSFPKKSIHDLEKLPEENGSPQEIPENLIQSDLLLWQRDVGRSKEIPVHRKDAFNGYKRATEMYVVKESTVEGKSKIRFASTNGVLVNKKQA